MNPTKKNILTFFVVLTFPFIVFAQFGQNRIKSPEIHPDNKVTFRVQAPKADSVLLVGNWMPPMQSIPLTKSDSGLWHLTIDPLAPELYGYRFLIDGVPTLDPANLEIKRDGTFRTESVLFIRGEASELYEPKVGPKGILQKVWYESPTLKLTRRMYVYTPPGYENSDDDYPVLYLLHGGGGDEDAWTTLGLAPTIMDNLINAGKAKPMIVVMTNGNPDQAAAFPDAPHKDETAGAMMGMANGVFEKSLVNDVIPYVEAHYRVKTGKESRAMTGLSMGGHQTINTTLQNPELFDYIGVMSMGFADFSRFGIEVDEKKRSEQINALKNADPKLYWIACGKDDFLYETVVTMREELDGHNLDYKYRESTGGHTWNNWRIYLSEFAPMLFK